VKVKMVYVLRGCDPDLKSKNGFQWPASGRVAAPDWDPEPKCGNGLHGFLRGEGDASLAPSDDSARWLVVRVRESECVDLIGKVKFPKGDVVFCGARSDAVAFIQKKHPRAACIYGTATAGNGGTATAGNGGTATAGGYGTATAGDYGTATAGNGGTATAGDYGTATAGDYGTATAGYKGILQIRWFDGKRRRIATAYVGENGIKVGHKYRLDVAGAFVPA
jgi:hypothetical protein